ncbi:MAG TPA: hydrogenase maturation protein [Novimethylophilus sp.]|jgi:putative two-component system hydrogenase maturation factor HypX/HoxX|uniref:hydrogenase maturation protein n=1 Tax=Novimethylophilus sp. TaxID=2137426 RepID=UPI002F40D36D
MRILFLTHSFNSLAQRLWLELTARGHEVSVEFDIADTVTEEAVALWRPDIIVAPFLKRAIPASIWSRHVCLVVHPGIVGDRGPSSLDWAIQQGETEWGVTVLQANAVMDGGDIWAAETFSMRPAKKSSLYRNEVTEAAVRGVLSALDCWPDYQRGIWRPMPLDYGDAAVRGRERPAMRQADREIDWQHDDTTTVLRKIHAADGSPGVRDILFGQPCLLFDARLAHYAGEPGALLGRSGAFLLRATVDGAVWIGHARRPDRPQPIKLPAAVAFADEAVVLPELGGADDIRYEEIGEVGLLHFDFYNGAMSSGQCLRLCAAFAAAQERPTRVLVLMGGEDFWSNGIHLNRIEAADSPADESLRNIEAMDDLALAILQTHDKLTVAALQGNAGAGGCFLALAADEAWARDGIVLNPHYRNMGNLYGSEYWTYLLPRRVGMKRAQQIMHNRLPLSAKGAAEEHLLDACLDAEPAAFRTAVKHRAQALAAAPDYAERLAAKGACRVCDEAKKPLAAYRAEELAEMRRNFYGFDPSYHYARQHFVFKQPHAWTPRHLALHRDLAPQVPPGLEALVAEPT